MFCGDQAVWAAPREVEETGRVAGGTPG